MIGEYYRPESVEEVIQLLSQNDGELSPMGGGTLLSRQQRIYLAWLISNRQAWTKSR